MAASTTEEKPSDTNLTPKTSKSNPKLECSNSGFTKMVRELVALLIFLISFAKETFSAMLPVNLQKSLNYAYSFMLGINDWIGYALAALYYFSVEYDFGETLCEIMGYGYEAIDALQVMVQFTETSKSESASS